jgi:GrpB-like predicted nucleotidyltransferase (UPF0157 family)
VVLTACAGGTAWGRRSEWPLWAHNASRLGAQIVRSGRVLYRRFRAAVAGSELFVATYPSDMRIMVVAWNPEWLNEFESISREIQSACASIPVRSIEHVGSTSVPGLVAKPIIDVAVVVGRGDVDGAIDALEAAGYCYLGERGIPDRHAFSAPPHGSPRHVYVAVDGSLALRNHLTVRDVLRSDPELRRSYGELKLELASSDVADTDAYVAAKSPVLQEVLQSSGRFSPDELAFIAALNNPPEAG